MYQTKKTRISVLLLMMVSVLSGSSAFSQTGASSAQSPYTIFGPGKIIQEGTAYHKSMGGTGIASRNRRVINYMNPAALTARDSLAFMTDFGLTHSDELYKKGSTYSGSNITNFNDIVISFPIYKSSAMMLGIAPYSGLGYQIASYETDPELIGNLGNITKTSSGTGGLYQLFVGGGVTFWKRLSLGAEFIHYFGKIQKGNTVIFSSSNYNGVSSGYNMVLRANTAKFGLQYEQPIGSLTVGVGATYKLDAPFSGKIEDYKISTASLMSDTLRYAVNDFSKDKVSIASELGVGASVRYGEKWRAEVDYVTSYWSRSGMEKVGGFSNESKIKFSATDSRSIRAGFEFIPNVNDVRYYMRRVSYKAGAYMNREYYVLDGNMVNSMGLTLGATFPISNQNVRSGNGVSLSVDFGQRGSVKNNLTRENYITFTIGLNAFDIWFQKSRYQ